MGGTIQVLTFCVTKAALAAVGVALFLLAVRLYTTLRLQLDTQRFRTTENDVLEAPRLPFTIPWLGSAPQFLVKEPHKFWRGVFSNYPLNLGAIHILLGGKKNNVVFDRTAVSYILKDRKLDRNDANIMVTVQGFGMEPAEVEKFYEYHTAKPGEVPGHVEADVMNGEYLLKSSRVTEMTNEYVKLFQQQLQRDTTTGEISLYDWLRRNMFVASTASLMGTRIFECIPDLETQFFNFDKELLSMFFGLPKFMIRKQIAIRDKITDSFDRLLATIEAETDEILDPESPEAWEPNYGSRINRARHIYYRKKGLKRRTQAALNNGELFGISSNSIPCTGWLLLHILATKSDPSPNLFEHIMAEVQHCRKPDGTVDIPALMTQPILRSTLHEVLRKYVDVLITRTIRHPMNLPFQQSHDASKGKSGKVAALSLQPGTLLMAPSWPSHFDHDAWTVGGMPSPDEFYPYRFLQANPDHTSDKPVFSTSAFDGKFLPFGGGRTQCPGRRFATFEILASVAVVLLRYDVDVLGYVDDGGSPTENFPGLRDTYPGSAVMVAKGDMKVKLALCD